MFEKITPEQAGISSKVITGFINKLEKRNISMHSLLFMKGNNIFAEAYWKPFTKDTCHRQYSQTKSFVSIAIGLLLEEGKLALDDKIIDYFPEKIDGEIPKYLDKQTIREMLMMKTVGQPVKWLNVGTTDRTHLYLNYKRETRPSGSMWEYDSAGSQVLSSLVEKLAKKPLLDYLKEKLFNEMGTFQTATVLKTPNGDSWGDSAMLCTLRDMASFGRLVMNYGVWNGKRLMDEKYLKEATSKLVDNSNAFYYSPCYQGYGYQIWRVSGGGFAFVGMGDQLTVCYPDKNIIFACNCDNQGNVQARDFILSSVQEIVENVSDKALENNVTANAELYEKTKGLDLRSAKGFEDSALREKINGVEYECEENMSGLTKFSLTFKDKKSGEFRYTNAQGEKVIPFGVNHNVFGKFPQLGYSNEIGGQKTTDGFMYDDAVSFAWVDDSQAILFVQIIDKYLGNLDVKFSFKGESAVILLFPNAECFLTEYAGIVVGKQVKKD